MLVYWNTLAYNFINSVLDRCPHCQHYKWEYVEIAEEVQRRSVTPGM